MLKYLITWKKGKTFEDNVTNNALQKMERKEE